MSDVNLAAGAARLRVARLGAEMRAWSVGGVDLLWPGDPAIWPEISPILFPVVGWTRDGARVAGQRYDLGLHGFARRLTFEVERQAPDFVRLSAHDDAGTLAIYPFPFRFAVEYRLSGDAVQIVLEAGNPGDNPMPYACGLHPGFNWPPGKRVGAKVRFSSQERSDIPIMAPGGLIDDARRTLALEGGRVLKLDDDALFAHDALCFLDAASEALRFERADGSALELTRGDFPHVALWTRPGAPFLCLEAWTGFSDPKTFAGDLYEKPSMRVLPPGAAARFSAKYQFSAASVGQA